MKEIPRKTAKEFILYKQKLTPATQGDSKSDVLDVIRDLAGIQYDPLPIVAQAHYLTLWNRVRGFREEWLDSLLYQERSLIEFMLMRQALHIVPTSEFPYYYSAVQAVFRKGWVQNAINAAIKDKMVLNILKKIEENGIISSKGLPYARFRPLFYSGKLAIAKRDAGIFRMPYYSPMKRLHPNIDLRSVDEKTGHEWLVTKTIGAFGLASDSHIAYWIGLNTDEIAQITNQLEKKGIIISAKIEGVKRLQWMLTKDLDILLSPDDYEESIGLLSPMDNLTRDRKWLYEIFGYTFDAEYFQKKGMRWQLSILCDAEFLGFIDAKMDRPRKTFIIKEFVPCNEATEKAWMRVFHRIVDLAKFHGATAIEIVAENPEPAVSIFRKLGLMPKERHIDVTEQPKETDRLFPSLSNLP